MPRTARIVGTGLYAPERVVPNEYFNTYYGEDVDTFLRTQRNIYTRHFAGDDEPPSFMVAEAAREAMDQAGIQPDDLDLILVSTDTPDYQSPSTAAIVQHRLGAPSSVGTFDINTACAGFVTALDIAHKYLVAESRYRYILVAGVYAMSRFLDLQQRNVATLFGDGAGAVILTAADTPGILTSRMYTEGQYYDYMGVYVGAAAPCSPERVQRKEHLLQFRKKFPRTFNPDHWTSLIQELCTASGFPPEAVDCFFFTQINVLSIYETLDRLGLPHERAHYIMDRYGYTGNACIAMGLADAVRQGRLNEGARVMLIASGGGAAVAGMSLIWKTHA